MGAEGKRAVSGLEGLVDTVADLHDLVDVLTAFSGGILIEVDREGRYLRIWTGEPELLVRPIDEILGRSISDVLGPAGARFHETIRVVFDTDQPAAVEYTLDVQAGRRTFSCEIRPHTRSGGGPKTLVLLVRDITAAKALEAKLLQTERLAALGLLAARVGHEIRQPLAYVSTSLELLERDLATTTASERMQTSLASIRGGARRIAEIATSLDLLAGRGRRPIETVIDIRSPLTAALDLCASELSGVRVERTLAEVLSVRGDEGELCQVFANLVLNAAQSIVPGTEATAAVRVTLGRAGNRVRVSVSDDGSGIAPENVERIFDPFFTTKGDNGGTGLGLFITRGIVEAHGGTVELTSTIGCGTTVEVFLPIATVSGASRAVELPKEPVTGVRPVLPSRRLSLLIIDDEPRFLQSLRLALGDLHDVDARPKAREALEVIEKDPVRYDVVLCDLAMPGLDGAAFYERMVALGIADRFVLMTGGAFTERAAEFLAQAACPRISKPFQVERLLALLEDVTRGRSAS